MKSKNKTSTDVSNQDMVFEVNKIQKVILDILQINKSIFHHIRIFTARKRSLGQGNMFTGVCLSTGGGVPDQVHPPRPGTPPNQEHPPSRPPRSKTRYTPQDQVHPPMTTAAGGTHPTRMHSCLFKLQSKQECIPVGCVPSAAVAISGGGDVCLGECLRGGCTPSVDRQTLVKTLPFRNYCREW